MDLTLPALLARVRDTIADPRGGARAIIALQVPARTGWAAIGLMAVVSTLFTHIGLYLSPPETQEVAAKVIPGPFATAFLQTVGLVVTSLAIWRVGQARGGRGSLDDAVALLAWLQFVMLVLQGAMTAGEILLPPLAGLFLLAGLALFFWLMVNFVAELHGFRSLLATFFGIVVVTMVLAVVVSLILYPILGPPMVKG